MCIRNFGVSDEHPHTQLADPQDADHYTGHIKRNFL